MAMKPVLSVVTVRKITHHGAAANKENLFHGIIFSNMTTQQRLSILTSEQRSRLGELGALEELTPELRTELDTLSAAHTDTEAQLRAAIAADAAATPADTPAIDGEVRERLELRAKTGIGDFLRAAAGGQGVVGAAAEYAASLGVPTVGHLPMALFAPTNQHSHIPTVETRAITAAPAVDGPLRPVVPYVFERSAANSLGIMMPTVEAGQVQIPKITTAPPSDTLSKDGSAPSTAASVTLTSQAPKRIAGSFEVRVEDLSVMPSMEAALSESMQGSLSNELDEQVFNGASTELDGLFVQAANVNAATATETFATGVARFAALVDGKHAYDLSDLRAVIGSATFGRYSGQFSGNGAVSLFDYLRMNLGSIRVSDRVPAKNSNAQKAIVVLSASAESPKIHVWSSLEIIRDPYSSAPAGKITITATSLVSPLWIPHGTSQVKEVHPKIS